MRWWPVILLALGFLSCENDIESIRRITFRANDPDQKTTDLSLIYTDSGMAKVHLYARLAESYSKPKRIVTFKDGVRVEFYDESGKISSVLTALYGEIDEESGKMLVRDSVRLFNPKKEQRLETEALYWNRMDSTIVTDKKVMIRTPKSILFGTGLKTKQDFNSYTFYKPEGKIDISEYNNK